MDNNLTQEYDSFIVDCPSPNGKWITTFEDNGENGCMCLYNLEETGEYDKIVDHLDIYAQIKPSITEYNEVFIIWADNSSKTALLVDGECWGIFDLSSKRKLSGNTEGSTMTAIGRTVWCNGIHEFQGETLKLNNN